MVACTILMTAAVLGTVGGPVLDQEDATGSYAYTLAAADGGEASSGTFDLSRRNGQWTGVIRVRNGPATDFTAVRIDGNRMTLHLDGGDQGTLVLEIVREGTTISGTWSLAGETGAITGRKTA